VPWQQLAGVVALTLSVGIGLTLWVEGPFTWDDAGPIAWILGVGLPEEGAKLLGVFVVVHVVKARYTPRTFLFLGAVSGLAFGAAEAAGYAINGGAFTSSESELVVTAVWRLLTGSLFHACMAGITAFFLGLAQERARHARALVVTGLLVAGVLHGVYDDVADDYVGVLVAAAVVLTFIAYAERGEQVLERLAGAPLVAPSPLPADVQ
jgi:RsiW-degrading membrane proteinase PrsW (M82 family)